MPIYEFLCQNDHKFEFIRSMSVSSESAVCPKCGGWAERIMSIPSRFQRGWGFLKELSRKSVPAPNDAGYHPEWDG